MITVDPDLWGTREWMAAVVGRDDHGGYGVGFEDEDGAQRAGGLAQVGEAG